MSMFDDVLGLGRSSVIESVADDALEPEIANMTLEEAELLDESVDPMDFILGVAYQNEMNMMRLDAAIVAEEYLYLRENGEEMVTESGKIDSIINKFKTAVKWLWEKIQTFFKTVMKKFDEALKLDQRFLDKYEKKAAGNTGTAKGTASLFNVKEYQSDAIALLDFCADAADEVMTAMSKDEVINFEERIKDFRAEAFLDGEVTEKEALKVIIKDIKDSMKVGTFSADKAIKAFKESKGVKAEIKKAYDTNKKAINKQLKAAKTMERVAKKFKVIPTETSKAVHGGVKTLNKFGSALTIINRAYIKVINMSRSFCKAVIISAAAKYVEKEKTNESTSIIDSLQFV